MSIYKNTAAGGAMDGGPDDYDDAQAAGYEDAEEGEASGYAGSDAERIRLFKLYDVRPSTFASPSTHPGGGADNISSYFLWGNSGGGGPFGGEGFGGPDAGLNPFFPCVNAVGGGGPFADSSPGWGASGGSGSGLNETLCNYTSPFDNFSDYLFDGLNVTGGESDGGTYTVWQLVVLGILAGATSIVTVVGNMIVILSFVIERTIRQPTNYFIASLAVSDLFIGSISMPFYTIYLLMGKYWPLGEVLCDLWLSIDYTVCLCSIYTVFCITIDRFCSVIIPAKYRNWRTDMKVLSMVAATWVIPVLVFFTSIFGWQYFVGIRTVLAGECYVQYLENPLFNCFLQVGYFWITLVVMCALYTGIYRVAANLANKSNAKHKKATSLVSVAGCTMTKIGIGVSQQQAASPGAGGTAHSAGGAAAAAAGAAADHAPRPTPAPAAPGPGTPVAVASGGTGNKNGTTELGVVGLPVQGAGGGKADGSSSPGYPSDTDPGSSQSAASGPKRNGDAVKIGGDSVGKLNGDAVPVIDTKADPSGMGAVSSNLTQTAPQATNNDGTCGVDSKAVDVVVVVQNGINEQSECSGNGCPDSTAVASHQPSSGSQTTCADVTVVKAERVSTTPAADSAQQPRPASASAAAAVHSVEISVNQPSPAAAETKQPQASSSVAVPPPAGRLDDAHPDSGFDFPEPGQKIPGAPPDVKPSVVLLASKSGPSVAAPTAIKNAANKTPPAKVKIRRASSSSSFNKGGGKKGNSKSPVGALLAGKNGNKKGAAPGGTASAQSAASKSENRARKALRTITVILGAFILCWTPWHVLSMIIGFYGKELPSYVGGIMYDISYWLCYLNSPINPFCYALANQQFKKTFSRILRLDWHRT